MGLSNEERIHGLFYAIEKVVSCAKEISDNIYDKNYGELKRLCSELWHDFLGKQTNNTHWLLGSSATAKVTFSTTSPWGVVVMNGIMDCRKKDDFETRLEPLKDLKDYLSIAVLLQKSENKELAQSYLVFTYLESVAYYLRRYEDELLQDYESLSKKVSDIMGICFSIFNDEQELCTRAYLLNRIVDELLIYPYTTEQENDKEKKDVIAKIVTGPVPIYDLAEPMSIGSCVETKTLASAYKKLMALKKENKLQTPEGVEARLLILFQLCNRTLHNRHRQDEIKIILTEAKTKIDKKKLDGMFQSFVEIQQERDKEGMKRVEDTWAEDFLFEEIE